MLLSALCFQEPITPCKIGALLLTFCGCVLVAGLFPAGVGASLPPRCFSGLGSGFGYALYSISSKLALKQLLLHHHLPYCYALPGLLPLSRFMGGRLPSFVTPGPSWAVLA